MTQLVNEPNPTAATEPDLVAGVQRVLQESPEPLTLSKIRAALPVKFRSVSLEDLAEVLRRQVSANVVYQYPKYRSQQDRFWDRPMPVHVEALIRDMLQEEPLGWSELRRKLPLYAQEPAGPMLQQMVAQGQLHRHPRLGRGSERFGVGRPDPREYLRTELIAAFSRLEQLGFSQSQLRQSALELLHEEEWASLPAPKTHTAGDVTATEQPQQPADSAPSIH